MTKKILNKKVFLVVAAHPDDEVLGCGGTIRKLVLEGNKVYVLFLSDGVSSRKRPSLSKEIKIRKRNAIIASKILGTEIPIFEKLKDNQFDKESLLNITKIIEKHLSKIKPEVLITHSSTDLNVDHKITNKAVVTACRPQNSSPVRMLLFFEILSSTEWNFSNENNYFKPNYFVNIVKTLDKKLAAMRAYKSELRRWPHPRSIDGIKTLSKYRGMSSGLDSAEAFVQAFKIDKDQQ